ncbi:MAG TPA: hypothetical protein VN784_02355 [Candidatus Limnocylindrales bacterium]|nr:hypothetical protein [Candidatus Limnocylindrales bacterium]
MSETEQTKVCPHCAETIKVAAKVCPHCRCSQKRWSLQNPQVGITLWVLLLIAAWCCLGVLVDNMFAPKQQFAAYRNQISVVSSQFSQRVSSSDCDTNVSVYVTVVGILTNRSKIAWKDVGVEAQFLDKTGRQFDAITVNADEYRGVTVLPYGEAAFKIEGRAARPDSDYGTYKVTVRWAKDVHQLF